MTVTISDVLVTQFSDRVHIAAQQKSSRLKPFVELQTVKGEDMAYDGLGAVEVTEVTDRYQDVAFTDAPHNRRKLTPKTFHVTLPIDEKDVNAMLSDPSPKYVDAVTNALYRKMDKVIYDSLFASVLTGRSFGTTVTAASDGVLTVDATAGFTYEKVLEVIQNFIDNEVGNDMNTQMVMGIGGEEHTDLKGEIEFNSTDYERNFEVKNGRLSMVEGMNVLLFGTNSSLPIIDVATTTASCFAMAQGAVCLGLVKDLTIKVQERTDKVMTSQVQVLGTFGAVRTEGKLVQKVTTTRAA